ncbi:hypothetical protein IWQ60_007608 [Tieghemiomyces parasiticus]|uniref:Protein AAR2 homolog n=1 Tax=Tieghemiomyces parasiticus TaxID=78921 RepID=A0A9W7ZX85_9FUNG|nr:hypothetical protein IWQ60_007608 [Tieghemiomyces parasiticus]
MNQQAANHLFEKGGILLFLDAPADLDFGIDTTMWRTGPRFKGVKLIPPGVHFIYYKQWNPEEEDLYPADHINAEQQERYRLGIREFDPMLGAYPLDTPVPYQTWRKLSGYVTTDLLARILPGGRVVSSVDGGPYDEAAVQDGTGIPFTRIDLKRSFPSDAHGPQRTRYSQDKSWLLRHLMTTVWHNDYRQPLGEMQLGFICLLMGQMYAGFEQWKSVVHLLCQSEEAIPGYSADLYPNFIGRSATCCNALDCTQMPNLDQLDRPDILQSVLITLAGTILHLQRDHPMDMLVARLKRLSEFCVDRFGQGILPNAIELEVSDSDEGEEGEYAPVVVEL